MLPQTLLHVCRYGVLTPDTAFGQTIVVCCTALSYHFQTLCLHMQVVYLVIGLAFATFTFGVLAEMFLDGAS